MSVTEIAPRGNEDFERTPPHDIAAEQCVLGGMLLSKDAISDVLEVIKGSDYYRPAHQIVHEVILDLYGRGEPADAVTVAAELTRRGDIGRMGGAPYLHTLIASVPTAANAGYYARIVRERAVLRRLVEVGTRIVQLGYSGDGDADELVDRAEAEVYGVTDRRVSEDYAPLSEIMPGALDEIEAIGSRGGSLTGVPTGFADLDALTNGLHPGQMIVIAARPAIGKALALDTPLPTPTGWTTMAQVQVGDQLIGTDGKPTRVVAATKVMISRPCFAVEFDDGTVIVADAQHQWRTSGRASAARSRDGGEPAGCGGIVTTAELAMTLRAPSDRQVAHAVAVAQAADLPSREVPFPPYALGAWLGNGLSRAAVLATADPEIILQMEAEGLRVTPAPGGRQRYHMNLPGQQMALEVLGGLGVLGRRHIPAQYLRTSQAQRRALLAGLLDTRGHATGNGTVRFAATGRRLAADTLELVQSLGYPARLIRRGSSTGTAGSPARHLVTFTPEDKVFRVTRKLARQSIPAHPAAPSRLITDVRPVPTVPVRCVQVDAADHMYLAGPSWIPTHNSTLALDLARAAAVHSSLATVIFSLEMSRNEITMRLLSAEARVALHAMRTGQLGDDDWSRLARRMSEVADAPLFIDDSPNMSMMEIRAKCRRLKQRNDLRLVIVDYLQLMSSPKRVENRQQEVSELSRSLKLLAKELNVPVVALSQLNRGPEQRTDKRPMLSDLRESGCLTADTTLLRADTGAPVTMRELLDNGHQGVSVWSVDEQNRIVAAPVTAVFPSGVKETYRLKLASGREVKASGNHPFLTFAGWRPLEELAVGGRIAIPRRVPEPIGAGLGWTQDRLGLLAHLIGGGCVLRSQPVHYTSDDEANLDFVENAAAAEFGITPRRVLQKSWWRSYLPAPYRCTHGRYNPLHTWFRQLGIENLRSYEKRIPAALFSGSDQEIAVFLRHLWATDGCVWNPRPGATSAPKVYYASSSRQLADDVALLLARLGIVARIRRVEKVGDRPGYHVIVADGPSLRTFCSEVGVHGRRGETARELLAALPLLEAAATSDVLWDRIESIEPLGPCAVFDATVKGTHNFIADGIFAHNSIEQDSDMVILLHREDAYERESPRAGEADFIVAKHRNGPTTTVTVAFQGHYSRFVDMAI